MTTDNSRRKFFATIGAAAAALALAVGTSTASLAAPLDSVPDESDVVITKLSQPNALQGPATGVQTPAPAGAVAIPDVQFQAQLVTGTGIGGANDVGTIAGQAYAAGLTAGTVATTPGLGTPILLGGTDADGVIEWNSASRGVYLVTENTTPDGVTAAAPFLLTVPLTNPTNTSEWLDTIYVYPKNSLVGTPTKTVEDADSLTVGEAVEWTITTDIPRNPNPAAGEPGQPNFLVPSAFRIVDTLQDDELELVVNSGIPAVEVTAGTTALVFEDHFTVTPATAGGATTHTIEFTPAGLAVLTTVVNATPAAQLTIELTTTVLAAVAISNQASIYYETGADPLLTNEVESRYGSYQIVKLSSDNTVTDLSGAVFQVYSTEAAALEGDIDYLVEPTDNNGVVQSSWTTDAAGNVVIQGLRHTAYANGQVLTSTDAEYQTYWLVEVTALPGHQLLAEPVEFIVDGSSATQTAQTITNQATTGGFVLPLTGGAGTTAITVTGLALLALVMVVVLRRRHQEVAE